MTDNGKGIKTLNLLISLVVAFATWVFVVYNYYPTKNITYYNVPIEFDGEETLAYNGLAIAQSDYETVNVKLNVTRAKVNNITNDDIVVQADVSNLVKGENGVSLTFTPPEGATFVSADVEAVSVMVEKNTSKKIRITALYSESIDTVVGEPCIDSVGSREITVYGTEDKIKNAAYAALFVKTTDVLDSPLPFDLTPAVLDKKGREINHIVTSPDLIRAEIFAGSTKEVKLVLNVKDSSSVEKTYEAPATILVKGSADALKKIDSVETEEIDLSEITEDTGVALSYKLPSGINIAQKSLLEKLKVTIKQDK